MAQPKQPDKPPRQPRRNARPRIDALLKHIRSGSYDNDMASIQQAIDERREIRQEAVRQQVAEVFGEGYQIMASGPRVSRQRPGKKTPDDENVAPYDPELAEAEARAREEEERLKAEADGTEQDPEDSPDIESRSPIIGSVGQ